MMCPPDTWACRRTDFPPTSEDLRDYSLHKNKGNIKSVEPEIIKLHSKRASEFVYSDGYRIYCVKHRISVMYL